ncbi:MAG TPA: ribonuclease III [Planctomycetota bacterium]|jgi:ribonuclease-3|nr:ribonuclease III [Planctomycetota bacterium]
MNPMLDEPLRQDCEFALGYHFRNPPLLAQALTHASTGVGVGVHNERLEYLGDAVLSLVVAEYLFQTRPTETEGGLTERKSALVSRPSLARVAERLRLERFLIVGKGIPRHRPLPRSLLSNALEALLGAVYVDGGLEAARRIALDWLRPEATAPEAGRAQQNHKKALQHFAQREHGAPPVYRVLAAVGPDCDRAFKVAAEVNGRSFPGAWGKTKREAEQWAAREALLQLESEGEVVR